LIANGGVGIAKNLYANGVGAVAWFNNSNVAGNLGVTGGLYQALITDATSIYTGAFITAGGVGIQKNLYANDVSSGAYFNNVVAIGVGVTSTTDSTSTATGSLRVSGGAGIAKNLYANGTGAVAWFNNIATTGVSVGSFVDSTSITTGALTANGGVGITKNLYANGVGAVAWFNNVATTAVSVGSYVDSTSITTGSLIANGGVGIAKNLYANGTGARAFFTGANVASNLGVTGGLYQALTTDSTSIFTGSFITAGGVGIQKNLYANDVSSGAYFNNANIAGTIGVVGAATFANTVNITGASTLSNTVSIAGAATFANTLGATGAVTFANTLSVTGSATFASTLGATGAVTFANTLSATGSATFSNTVSITGTLTANGGTFNGVFANSAGQDVIISGTSSAGLGAILAQSGVTAGGYGSSVNAISIVVDAKGRVTSISNTAINVNTALGYTPLGTTATFANSASQDITIGGTYAALTATLATSGVTAGGYGSSVNAISIVVDAKGRVTSISNTAINVNTALGYTPLSTTATFANSASQDVQIGGTYAALTATLATSGVTAGGYGSSVNAISIVVDAKGRVTSISNTAINVNTALGYTPLSTAATFANTAAQDVQIGGTFDAITATLATSGVTAGGYGNTTSIPTITVDAKGRVTSVSNNTISTTPNATYVQNTDSRTLSGNLIFSSVLNANTTNAAIIISGGVLLAKNFYANGSGASAYFNNANVMGNLGVTGTLTANGGTFNGVFANSAAQDVTITGTSSVGIGAILATSGVTAGGYGSSVNAISIVVDAKGRVTSISNTAINVNTALGYTPLSTTAVHANSASQDVQIGGTFGALTAVLATSGVTAGGYGSAANAVSIVVDAKGRVTSISNVAIAIPTSTVNTTGNFTIAGNLVFSGINTHFNSTVTIDTGASLSLNTLLLSNTAGSLDLNTNGIKGYVAVPGSKSASFIVANTDSGSIFNVISATTPVVVTLPSAAVSGFNATIVQTGNANVNIWSATGTLLKRTGVGANSSTANIGGLYGIATVLRLNDSTWIIGGDVF
jgi:hypothetical protein